MAAWFLSMCSSSSGRLDVLIDVDRGESEVCDEELPEVREDVSNLTFFGGRFSCSE